MRGGSPDSLEARVSLTQEARAALERAGRFLARRAHSRHELRDKLRRAGFGDDAVDAALERADELGLVDDAEFAHAFVARRLSRSPLGCEALVGELGRRGIDRSLAEEAVRRAAGDGDQETAAARAVAERAAERLHHLPAREQRRRLWRRLAARGFSEEACDRALSAVLPPEGWD
ncbi:MAG TPA: regulatory protein RecX [Actinomycetota bacterium]|jgi:regulatory protein|nr:regulatory protein RecX [Actinomycetota bacterium]